MKDFEATLHDSNGTVHTIKESKISQGHNAHIFKPGSH